jgi:sarcosine oxidase
MRSDYEYIVLGLGGIGSAAAYWLSRRFGDQVLGLEQFELGHVRGESQDHSRIIRLSYHRPDYVELAKLAYRAWASVEADAGEQLVLKTGGLDFGPRDGAIPLQGYMDAMTACDVPFEHLDASSIMRRWPQFRVGDDIHGVFQAESGIAMAARANAAHQRMAREHGAHLRERAGVTYVKPVEGEFEVLAGETPYRCRKLIIAAGPWSNEALSFFGIHLPLEITKEQVTYFAAPDIEAFSPGRFPVWIWMHDPSFYGMPVFGEAGPKAAQDAGGKAVDPDTRSFEPDEENFARLSAFLERYIPGAIGPVIYTKTCLYTLPPDRDFIIDSLAGHPGAVMAIGAGHAFKFASVIGKTLSELAADGATEADISGFRLSRPILREAHPNKTYMV